MYVCVFVCAHICVCAYVCAHACVCVFPLRDQLAKHNVSISVFPFQLGPFNYITGSGECINAAVITFCRQARRDA